MWLLNRHFDEFYVNLLDTAKSSSIKRQLLFNITLLYIDLWYYFLKSTSQGKGNTSVTENCFLFVQYLEFVLILNCALNNTFFKVDVDVTLFINLKQALECYFILQFSNVAILPEFL